MEHDDGAMSIVCSIRGLAGALELKVIAEGVETERQSELISREGRQEIQGYYYSRPVSAEALARLAGTEPPFKP